MRATRTACWYATRASCVWPLARSTWELIRPAVKMGTVAAPPRL